MNPSIDRALARADACARRMLRDGYEPHLIHDALITTGLSVWAADSGHKEVARELLTLWVAARDSALGAE